MSQQEFDVTLELLLERELMRCYGPMVGNDDLLQALGYPSKEAFRQAIVRKSVPVPIFDVENRRGKFALVRDIAIWLVEQRQRAVNLTTGGAVPQQDESKGGPMS